MKVGSKVLYTSTGGHGWYSSKRVKRTGTIERLTHEKASVRWDETKKRSSVNRDQLTLLEE